MKWNPCSKTFELQNQKVYEQVEKNNVSFMCAHDREGNRIHYTFLSILQERNNIFFSHRAKGDT